MRTARAGELDAPPPALFAMADVVGRDAALWLRELITSRLTLEERFREGWKALTYHHPVGGYVAGVFPRAGHAELVIEHGAALDAFADLFDSVGAQVGKFVVADVPDRRAEQMIDAILAEVALRVNPR